MIPQAGRVLSTQAEEGVLHDVASSFQVSGDLDRVSCEGTLIAAKGGANPLPTLETTCIHDVPYSYRSKRLSFPFLRR